MRTWGSGGIIFLLAFLLRTCGLSNDLHLDRVYHPDTPKQIRATERFIQGEYYTVIGGRDYEGYPYFNSHLAALAYRAYRGARGWTRTHIGVPDEPVEPELTSLYWLTRLQNAFLSALIPLMLFLAGRRFFDGKTGWYAGLLAAVSPVDITAAHYATGDTAASFFATAAVVAALGIARTGNWRWYIGAALLTGAAFSSKYHGGMALIAALTAHLWWYPHPKNWFSKPSLLRALILGVALLVSILVTSPALIIYPKSALRDIIQFVEYTASFGMTAEMAALPVWSRFWLGMQVNMPVLADVLGPAVILAVCAALLLAFRSRETWVLASLPLAYVLAGLATKPLTHAVYHSLAAPTLMLLAAKGLRHIASRPATGRVGVWVSVALMVAAWAYLANYARRELFFFRHNDTRYLAELWAHDNVPKSFMLDTRAYSFDVSSWTFPRDAAEVRALVLAREQQPPTPGDLFFSHVVALERDKLTVFRNWNQYFFLPDDPRYFRPAYHRPGFQPLPSSAETTMLFADQPWTVRTPKKFVVTAPRNRRLGIASESPLTSVWVHVQTGSEPLSLRLRLAGHRERIRLGSGESHLIRVETPRRIGLTRTLLHFYSASFKADYGSGRVFIATSQEEMAWLALHSGRYAEAYALFDPKREPVMYLVSGLLSGALQPHEIDSLPDMSDSGFFEIFGMSPGLLEIMPGDVWTLEDLRALQMRIDEEKTHPLPRIHAYLKPGIYRLDLTASGDGMPYPLALTDPWGVPIALEPVSGEDAVTAAFLFELDRGTPGIQWQVDLTDPRFESLHNAQIRPDLASTQRAWRDWLRLVIDGDLKTAPVRKLYYDAFLAMAATARDRAECSTAAHYYMAAIRSAPDRLQGYEGLQNALAALSPDEASRVDAILAPYRQTAAARTWHPVSVRLANGMMLPRYRIASRQVPSGGSLRLHMDWQTPRLDSAIGKHAAWIHLIPVESDASTIFGDRSLWRKWHVPVAQDRLEPFAFDIHIPEDAPTGTYHIRAGIWIPAQRRNIRVREADIESDRRGVFLGNIEILP